MSDPSLQSLLSTKAALDLGLISQTDFDAVKDAFVRAQQIKTAVDAGVIKAEDYESTKKEYLSALVGAANGGSGGSAAAAAGGGTQRAPPLAASKVPSLGPQSVVTPTATATKAPSSAPVSREPSPRPPMHPNSSGAGASQQNAAQQQAAQPRELHRLADQQPLRKSNSMPSVPTNIPKMGGIKPTNTQATSMSGISVTEDAVNLFYLMRLKATYKWALWQVDDTGSKVIIAAVGDKGSTYEDFLAALPQSDCRYGVYDFDFQTTDGTTHSKMVFFNWAPESARVRMKMMYASTKDFFKTHLDGISCEFQASDLDEITEKEVGDAVRALKRS